MNVVSTALPLCASVSSSDLGHRPSLLGRADVDGRESTLPNGGHPLRDALSLSDACHESDARESGRRTLDDLTTCLSSVTFSQTHVRRCYSLSLAAWLSRSTLEEEESCKVSPAVQFIHPTDSILFIQSIIALFYLPDTDRHQSRDISKEMFNCRRHQLKWHMLTKSQCRIRQVIFTFSFTFC